MNRIIKCVLLKIDVTLVTEIVEVQGEIGEPDCKLVNPYRLYSEDVLKLYGEDVLKPWPDITDQRDIMIHSDSILTIVDPKPKLAEKYIELTAR